MSIDIEPTGTLMSLEANSKQTPGTEGELNSASGTSVSPAESGAESVAESELVTPTVPASPLSSITFIRTSYQEILNSSYIKDLPNLEGLARNACALINSGDFGFERARTPFYIKILLDPFILACQSKQVLLQKSGIEGISRLINYEYIVGDVPVASEARDTNESSTMGQAIKAICDCFVNENTDKKIQTLIIQGLFTAISSPLTEIHQESLMRSIRTLYNIFLLSRNVNNQTAAQGTLVQIIRAVFGRIKLNAEKDNQSLSNERPASGLSVRTMHSRLPFPNNDVAGSSPHSPPVNNPVNKNMKEKETILHDKLTMEDVGGKAAEAAAEFHITYGLCEINCETNIQDGFLLFRALCKLGFKRYDSYASIEMRGFSLRSKLLALYLVMIVVSEFPQVFTGCNVHFLESGADEIVKKISVQSFAEAVKPYLGICLKSNLNSTVPKVFELSLAIFEGMVSNLRDSYKWEIEAVLRESIIPMIESKQDQPRIKNVVLTVLLNKLYTAPEILKFLFINYDCAGGNLKSPIFQQLATSISKMVLSLSMSECSTSCWDELDSFQKSANRLNREDLLDLPSLTSDKFTSNYIARSFFSPLTFTDTWIQIRGVRCFQDMVESLLEISGAQADFFKLQAQRVPIPFGTSLGPDDNLHPEEFTDSNSNSELPEPSTEDPLQHGIDLMQKNALKGLQYLIQNKILKSESPSDVAAFLLEHTGINLEVLSEFLGDYQPFSVSILQAIFAKLDFTGLGFVTSLRLFLSKMYLPGDSLKIDRLLLTFAEHYSRQNIDVISNPDTAYALAYSVLLLNTQLYTGRFNLGVTKSEFIMDNRGINHGADLPKELLEEIYHQISSNQLKINQNAEDTKQPNTLPNTLAEQLTVLNRGPGDDIESEATCYVKNYLQSMVIVKECRQGHSDLVILSKSPQVELARRMFDVVWMPQLATISELVKHHYESRVLSFSLFGFRRSALLAKEVGHDIALCAFFSALCNFGVIKSREEMRNKIFAAVVTMLDSAVDCGNALKTEWNDVLLILNRLAHLKFINYYTVKVDGLERTLINHSETNFFEINVKETELSNAQRLLISVDRLFMGTVRLSGPTISDFLGYLSQIAEKEIDSFPHDFDCLADQKSPRMFTILKLIEIVHINMFRIRLEWKRIWAVAGPFLCKLGCHPNVSVASFAVDSLYQIIVSYLQKLELPNYEFQMEVIHPLGHIIVHSPLISIRDSILNYILQLLHKNNIQSGWKAIIQVIGQASAILPESLATRALKILQLILDEHTHVFVDNFEVSRHLLASLTQFAKNSPVSSISVQSLNQFEEVSQRLIQNSMAKSLAEISSVQVDFAYLTIYRQFPNHLFWIPVFQCLMEMIMDAKELEVRNKAVELLFSYLYNHGESFPSEFWHHLFQHVLFPLLSKIPTLSDASDTSDTSEEANGLMIATVSIVLQKFVELFTHFFDKVFQFLEELLDVISLCLCQGDQTLCKSGADSLTILLEQNVDRMKKKDWQRVISIISGLFQVSVRPDTKSTTIKNRATPGAALKELQNIKASNPLPVIVISPTQQLDHFLTVINLVETVFFQNDAIFLKLNPDYVFLLLDLIERTYIEAQDANSTFNLNEAIKNNEVVKLEKFASTSLKLELDSLVCLVTVLLKMYSSNDPAYFSYQQDIEARLIPLCGDSFRQFNTLSELPLIKGINDIYQLWHEAVLRVGNFLSKAPGAKFQAIFSPISSEIIQTLKHHHLSHEVQTMLSTVLDRVNCLYIHPGLLPTDVTVKSTPNSNDIPDATCLTYTM